MEGRYRLTLGPHGFALFALKPVEAVLHLPSPDWAEEPAPEEADLPRVHMPGGRRSSWWTPWSTKGGGRSS